METFSALLALCAVNSPATSEFPSQRPVTRSYDVFFDLRLNKRLSKQSWGWWFETLSSPLWRHRNIMQSWLSQLTHICIAQPQWLKYREIIAFRINGFCINVIDIDVHVPHWGRVTHICVSKLTIIGSDNGLLPGGRQAIIWTNAGIMLILPLGTNFSEILIEIITFSFKKRNT